MRLDWLVFAFCCVVLTLLSTLLPSPATQGQRIAMVAGVVVLVLMGLALFGVLGGLR